MQHVFRSQLYIISIWDLVIESSKKATLYSTNHNLQSRVWISNNLYCVVIHYEIIPVIVNIFPLFWALLRAALSPVRPTSGPLQCESSCVSLSLIKQRSQLRRILVKQNKITGDRSLLVTGRAVFLPCIVASTSIEYLRGVRPSTWPTPSGQTGIYPTK